MKTVRRSAEPRSSLYSRLDGVCMSEQERDIAKAYWRMTEGLLDLAWLAGAHIRAAMVRISGASSKADAPARPKADCGSSALTIGANAGRATNV